MQGADECPRCGSSRTMMLHVHGDDTDHASCLDCRTIWEPIDPAELSVPGERFSCFKHPCGNCAFRPGSPERSDPQRWDDLMIQIHCGDAVFYCHKGVPLSDEDNESHEHFQTLDGKLDHSRLRMCAGYLAQRLGRLNKERIDAG